MRHLLLLILFNSLLITARAQQPFTPQQRAWLYRIVTKTPVLDRNIGRFFQFDSSPYENYTPSGKTTDNDRIEAFQLAHPESLHIIEDSLHNASPGILSQATSLLALYELNEQLKVAIYNSSPENERIYNGFVDQLMPLLPKKISAKKSDEIIKTAIHPSLPSKIKTEQLSKQFKLESDIQKLLLNKWHDLLNEYLITRSKQLFQILSPENETCDLTLIAAGEGSGTAGLLYETERHPDDSTLNWYGKGIGLFTYKMRTHKGEILPQTNSTGILPITSDSAISLHLSLWGLNSSFKPMIVITNQGKSYHLFSNFKTRELSPDPTIGEGLSYLDRINQVKEKMIASRLSDLNDENALPIILEKEYLIRDKITENNTRLELEIDSLQKQEQPSEAAITFRKNLINTNLTNLTAKETRIKELERKLSDEYAKIEQAEKLVNEMEAQLGENPQTWTKKDHLYTFADGAAFNTLTQDLILHSKKETEAEIRLLSASYSLLGDQRDEVQLLATKTMAPQKLIIQPQSNFLEFTLYFAPDAFKSETILPDTLLKKIIQLHSIIKTNPKNVLVELTPNPVNSAHQAPNKYNNPERERELPITELGLQRYATAQCTYNSDTLLIRITSSTDPVPTRLSKLPDSLRTKLQVTKSSINHNDFLSALRGLSLINTYITVENPQHIIYNYPLTEEQINWLLAFIRSTPPLVPAP